MRRLRSAVLTMSVAAAAGGGSVAAVAADDDAASRKPEDVIAAAQRDFAKVKSVHLTGTETENGGAASRISGTFTAAGPADFTLSEGKATAHLVILPKTVYIKGSLAYWKSVSSGKGGTTVARRLSGKWIKQSAGKGEDTGIADLAPKHIASCLGSHAGTLTNKGVKTVGGRKVIVIEDAGDKPGSAPGQLWVAADGAALPVRMVQTGPVKSGGAKDAACDSGGSREKTTRSDITFSQYNKTKKVTAPHGAVSPKEAVGGDDDGGGTTDL